MAEYMQKFDELKTQSQIVEDPRQTLARFKSSLKFELRKELIKQPLFSVEHAYQVALDLEEHFKMTTVKKYGETAANGFSDSDRTAKTTPPYSNQKSCEAKKSTDNNDCCFRCERKGYKAYNCPTRASQHVGVQPPREENHQHEVEKLEDEGAEFHADDLVDSDVDTSLAMVIRRILAAPKVERDDWRRSTIFQTIVTCGKQLPKMGLLTVAAP